MYVLMIVIFLIGYALIALEHPIHINKTATALVTAALCWVVLAFGKETILLEHNGLENGVDLFHFIKHDLEHHLFEIAEIIFFLMAAMTIVELIDAHEGFEVITEKIRTQNKIKLLWLVCIITFFLSAVLDNLATSIVIAALLKKLIKVEEKMWFFGGMVIIAANAGGAWSPIGDVTTIMLWVKGNVSAAAVVGKVFLPSLTCLLVPLIVLSFTKKEILERPAVQQTKSHEESITKFEQYLVFWAGIFCLLLVPIFKTYTHLPPFMGMLFSLGIMWVLTELLHKNKSTSLKEELLVHGVIKKIDTPSVLFFLGILLAVGSLQTAGHLAELSGFLNKNLGSIFTINISVGLLSALVDNVPLVAAAMKMYPLTQYAQDNDFWQLLAYCAGTGGSALIIGSAAGVAIMGILKINFLWYVRKITLLALLGYFAGVGVMYLMLQ